MNEHEPSLEELIATAKQAIDNYLASEQDNLERIDQIVQMLGNTIMRTETDPAKQSKLLSDLNTFDGLKLVYANASNDQQRKAASRPLRAELKKYFSILEKRPKN